MDARGPASSSEIQVAVAPEGRRAKVSGKSVRDLIAGLRQMLPRGRTLPEDVWRRRHRAMLALLYAQAVGLTIFALSRGYGIGHSLLEGGIVAAFAVAAGLKPKWRRASAVLVSIGLLTCSALLVHLWGGAIEAHFHFFVMIAILVLYEDWLPFLLAAGYVVLHHGLTGALAPNSVYNHAAAQQDPWKWAGIHALFVTGAGVASVVSWRLNEDVRAESQVAYGRASESEERFRRAFDDAPIGMALVDLSGCFIRMNRAFCAFTGRDEAELRGQSFEAIAHPEDEAEDLLRVDDLLDGSMRTEEIERRFLRADGEEAWAIVSHSLVTDSAGSPLYVVSQMLDITERKSAQLEREQLETSLRHAQRLESVGQLAGGVAHDFNNLLAVILNYATFVGDEIDDGSPLKEDVAEIHRAAERAAALTRQLLTFSHREVVKPEVIDLNAAVAQTEKLLRRTIGEQVNLVTVPGSDLWPVMADAGQMEQVLVNLAVNARDAMPEGGTLTIKTANVEIDEEYAHARADVAPGNYVRLTVSDTGCGMSQEVAERVFDPFFTTKAKGQGTGLGLATVYGIVTSAGGYVHVYSEQGQGTAFKVHLPATEEAFTVSDQSRSPSPSRARGERILVVEDEDAVRKSTCRILTGHGYEVIEASRGVDALEAFSNGAKAPDLLLTDVVMPEMSGQELGERMSELHPQLRILYMSGYSDEVVVRNRVLANEAGLLEKPFSADALLRRVAEALPANGHPPGSAAPVA